MKPFLYPTALSLLLGFFSTANVYAGKFVQDGSMTLIGQKTESLDPGMTLSADWWLHYEKPGFSLHGHIEGSSTPQKNTVSAEYNNANADAGSALNAKDQGRIQLSELYAQLKTTRRSQVVLGLMDASAWLDTSNISNDENTQFISADFVNNLVIDFPDYAPAIGVILNPKPGYKATFYLSSAQGLGDTEQKDYGKMLETGDDQGGAFIASEARFGSDNQFFALGAWLHSGSHQSLNTPTKDDL